MRLSSIYQLTVQNGEPNAATLGSRIRELRIRAGLTQAELGSPMTRSFVSAVEHGRALPSLPALLLISSRLGVPVGELLEELEWTWRDTYTAIHDGDHPTTPRDGR
ncbi:MAG TPA: helix-turn-helix transcriptional regulator [Patescibacteria group bacterium]|nr:helix-turn-helix transcriptional regulator [Patescibacteria group bacterium]